MNFIPRKIQTKVTEKCLEVLLDKKGRREVAVLPTAFGKSWIIAMLAEKLTDGNVLVLQPNIELLEQNLSKIESFGIFPAVYSASANRKELGHLIYATPKSVNFEVLKDANIKYVLIDECDFATQGNSELTKLLKQLKIKSVLGLTASPIYLTQTVEGAEVKIMTKVRGAFFKDICHVVQISEMVEDNYWCDIKYFDVFDHSNAQYLKLNESGSDYTEKSLETFYEKSRLKEKISDFLKRLPEGENALVFVPSIENVDDLVKLIPNSVGVHSKTDKKIRKEYVDGFKSGKYSIMVNALTMLAGFDKPDLVNVVDASPSNSLRVKIQKDGRGVRTYKDKEFCRIIDFAGNYRKFGDVRKLTVEYIENFGWGIFTGEKLLTNIPLNSKTETTKDYLKEFGKPNNTYIFGEENKGDAVMNFGTNKGVSVKRLYLVKRHYLKWLAESDIEFEDKELERQIKLIWS
jgi:DNA repair protein RadD